MMVAGFLFAVAAGAHAASVTVTPTSLSFGNQVIGQKSGVKTVTLKNNLTSSITINNLAVNLGDYSYTNGCPLRPSTLTAGQSCTISMFLTPVKAGSRSGSLSVNTSAGILKVSLSGTGIQPAVVNPASVTFAGQALGTTSPGQTVTLTNNQSTALTITSIAASVADFSATTNCPVSPSSLNAGGSCTATITFSPQAMGTRSGVLNFNDDAGNTPQTVSLSGTGDPAVLVEIAVTPTDPSAPAGATQQFTATGTFTDSSTQNLTETAQWSSDAPAIATISNSAGSKGLATGVAVGTARITALSGVVSGSAKLTVTPAPLEYPRIFVVFPPDSGVNNTHFMATVMNQEAIDGVTVKNMWKDVEKAVPGANTCSPIGTDSCQQDAFGWTHSYDWSSVDSDNAQWFAAAGGLKKVNILLFGIGGAGARCLETDSCVNNATPYYVNSADWTAHVGASGLDFINGVKDGCTNWIGKKTKSLVRDASGLVTVTKNNHNYHNGDPVWIGGTTPSDYNIAQTKITSVQEVSSTSTLTITAKQSYPAGMVVTFQGLGKATFLNGVTLTVASSTATQFTASFEHSDYGPQTETAGTATPAGATVQNATADTFQYQSGSHTAGSATAPGQIITPTQSWPIPYELAYKEGWKPFVAAALQHFANNPQVEYVRVGRSVGGEAFPYCTGILKTLPSPNAYSKDVWISYYTEISDWVQAQRPTMQILDPLNSAEGAPDYSYGTIEADIAVAHVNAAGTPDGFGSQGLRASDIPNYNSQPPQYCSSDWCGTFDTYYPTIEHLELQQYDLSSPNALYGDSKTADLRPLLPFAVERHMTILELYYLDALLAFDPNYCRLTAPDTGICDVDSIVIPTTTLPPGYQYPYFQAVGQPGQAGAIGDGSYADSINAVHKNSSAVRHDASPQH
jgi:hypothetical protein